MDHIFTQHSATVVLIQNVLQEHIVDDFDRLLLKSVKPSEIKTASGNRQM